jgi:ABC-2 type transport system permease protein
LRVALLIILKDLRQRARDRSALVIALVLPLSLAFIFSQILGGSSGAVTLDFALADEDGGAAARGFLEDVLLPIQEAGQIELTEVESEAEARQLATDGDVGAAFIIPAGFTAAVTAGEPATIQVLSNVDAQLSPIVASSIASAYAGRVTAIQTSIATLAAADALDHQQIQEITERAAAMPDPVSVDDVSAASKQLDPNTFYAAGMAVFFLFFSVQFGIIGILDERREGTLARMLAAPVRRWSVLVGKLGSSLVLGILSMAVLAIATSLMFGAEWGNPLGVGVLIVAGVLAATSVGALVVTFVKSPDQASSAQSIIAMLLGTLGGSFFPVALAGGLIEQLSLITPHAWFLRGLGELQGGGGLGDIVVPAAAIFAFAAVVGGAALVRQQRLVQS